MKMKTNISKLIILFSFAFICEGKRYTNYTLYRATPISQQQLSFLSQLGKYYEVNYWKEPGSVHNPVEFVIGPRDKKQFLLDVQKYGLYLATIMEDVQSAFDAQILKYQPFVRRRMETFDWQKYFRLEDIYNWLNDLHQLYSKEMQVLDIGTTYENRPIKVVKIRLKGARPRSKVIIEGGIHAREWISPAVVTFIINQLLSAKNSQDDEWMSVALSYEWYIIPVLNPDGYEYSHMKDRLWRKNRQPNGISLKDYGVDLNRNFGIGFGINANNDTNHETYCGPEPYSEREVTALRSFITEISKGSLKIEFYLALHSYGQVLIIPYSHTTARLENFGEMEDKCKTMREHLWRRYNTDYKFGNAFETVGYAVGGTSTSWIKKEFGVPYVLTIELRDKGYKGFALPTYQIIPNSLEVVEGLKAFFSLNESAVLTRSRTAVDVPSKMSCVLSVHGCLLIFCCYLIQRLLHFKF